ncbi:MULTISPECIES: hypothetical protein [unclassified Coleofasciculus]|uniref:hypothetical protein n=1 Tax=unclassified Coleofasciculus TaxID=2692782 RepID=UPI001880DA69|nr:MULTISPECIES: hypothetical protein [unclassified Coleofasciculus]MBE9127896.1 hypothetical protein [Coleofasciculus sp. LEGE 07081]MBE9148061.1 hypothetical protein [Coleofasciculus sp. LEGE 07092]
MKAQNLVRLTTKLGLLSALLITAACTTGATSQTPTDSQPELTPQTPTETPVDWFAQTQRQPNVQFNVQRQAGTCPQTVGLWIFAQGYEGGADHTVVADTQAIASAPAKLIASEPKRVEYEAPLNSEYVSCVGQAKSEQLRAYTFQFRDGKVYFQMDVSWADGYQEIMYKGVSAFRPYIHWRAEE